MLFRIASPPISKRAIGVVQESALPRPTPWNCLAGFIASAFTPARFAAASDTMVVAPVSNSTSTGVPSILAVATIGGTAVGSVLRNSISETGVLPAQ